MMAFTSRTFVLATLFAIVYSAAPQFRFLPSSLDCGGGEQNDQLVTVTEQDLKDILVPLAKSRNRQLQKKFYDCEDLEAKQVTRALRPCQKEVGLEESLDVYYDNIAQDPTLIDQIYQCIRGQVTQLNTREKREMVAFEDCARQVYRDLKRSNRMTLASSAKKGGGLRGGFDKFDKTYTYDKRY